MPASDLKDPNDRTWTGRLVATLYCPGCDEYSGGGLCPVCQRAADQGQLPEPEPAARAVTGDVQAPMFVGERTDELRRRHD